MKKIIIIILMFLGTVQTNFAQDGKSGKSGIRGGYHAAIITVDGTQYASTVALNSFYVGFFRERKLAPILHFGAGLEYFQNGFDSQLIDLQRKLHYISAPLYIKVKLGPVYATGGTALNFKVAENNNLGDASGDPLAGDSNVFDMPLQAGLGITILMVSLEIRYNWGMLEINDIGAKNQYAQLGLAVSF